MFNQNELVVLFISYNQIIKQEFIGFKVSQLITLN